MMLKSSIIWKLISLYKSLSSNAPRFQHPSLLTVENQLSLHLHDDKRLEEPSSSGPSSSVVNVHPPSAIHAPGGPVSTQESHKRARSPQEAETDNKVQRLMELGFDHNTVTQALSLFNGNEEQAASYLFGGF